VVHVAERTRRASGLPIRSTPSQKLAAAVRTLLRHGPGALARKVRAYLSYNLDSKWDFVYLAFVLKQDFPRVPMADGLVVRVATLADLDRVRAELFPEMTGEQAYETRYFDLLGQDRVRCFVAESDGLLVHYSWVFLDARMSAIIDTPFDRSKLRPGDVYIGPVFTTPKARGFIYPHVLSSIVHYLRETPGATRIVLFVQDRNPAAVTYYKRLGFDDIAAAATQPAWSSFLRKVMPTQPRPM
jgi:ribosomal protein S18 acetylase RimI-like enzyme